MRRRGLANPVPRTIFTPYLEHNAEKRGPNSPRVVIAKDEKKETRGLGG